MIKKAARKVADKLGQLSSSNATRKFIQHNRRVFSGTRRRRPGGPVVLFELTTMQSAHIAYSYMADALARRYDAEIRAFVPSIQESTGRRISRAVDRLLGTSESGVYDSFGTQSFLRPSLAASQLARAESLYMKTLQSLTTKAAIESITIDGIWIGDLIYDSFLMKYKVPTIDTESPAFRSSLQHSIRLFVFWQEYMDANDVKAVHLSHCGYNVAIPLRIAVKRGIPVFQATAAHVYRMNERDLFAYSDFMYFRERFASLPREVQEAGLAEAARRIERRFAGEVGVDMSYSTKSAYGKSKHERLLAPSPRTKVLIATHCFFDSPHGYGNNLFPDFYEWLAFLGRMTEETDYDWYMKTHPDYLPGTREILDGIIAKYPRLTLLPADSSHHQIIAEGLDVALTVYGTIGLEYAALGIPVINASIHNPHIAYDFNVHPKSVDEYRALLMNLDSLELNIDKRQVYEYYFMAHIYNSSNWLFDDYRRTVSELGGYPQEFTPRAYEKWLEEWSAEKHARLLATLDAFVTSGDFRMDHRHIGTG